MSKNHRENRKPAYADWTVHFLPGAGPAAALVTEARFTRDEHGGYVFTDLLGITADFPPGTVLHVMRKEPEVEIEIAWPLNLPPAKADEVLDSRA